MSRGLGERQRKMLRAVARAQELHPTWGTVPLSDVVNAFAESDNRLPELVADWAERRRLEAERDAKAWAEYRIDIEAKASAGDLGAIDQMRELCCADVLKSIIQSKRKSVQSQFCGRHKKRDVAEIDQLLNPSRIIGALVKRGLIERDKHLRGYVRLTASGQELI